MKNFFLLSLFWLLFCGAASSQTENRSIGGMYRLYAGEKDGFALWIVDGAAVRREIYPEFLYGGNPQRYLFIPKGEIWIDNAIAAEEFGYTVAHELHERKRMAREIVSYEDAHSSAIGVEQEMRRFDDSSARMHEKEVPRVSPTDCDGQKEISLLEDSIIIRGVYRTPLGVRNKISVWIVDGAAVRRDMYPDFGLSGNDLAYHFIPADEIWIDGQLSCEETEFSIAAELIERDLMKKGAPYDDAYEKAISEVRIARKKAAERVQLHPRISIPNVLDRDLGTGDEK